MPTGDVRSCAWPCEESIPSLRWPGYGNPPFWPAIQNGWAGTINGISDILGAAGAVHAADRPHQASRTSRSRACHALDSCRAVAFRSSTSCLMAKNFTRAYSIASPPSENGRVAFCVNRVQDGLMSNFLCDNERRRRAPLPGPFGNFILHPPNAGYHFHCHRNRHRPHSSMLHWMLADESRHQSKQLWWSSATAQRKTSTTTTDS